MTLSELGVEPRSAVEDRRPHLPGEVGTWVFIIGDISVFAVFFAAYLYDRGQRPELFASSQDELSQTIGIVNTLLLLLSSLFVVAAVRLKLSRPERDPRAYLVGAMLCGIGFSALKFVEYATKVGAGISPYTDDFFMWYFILTGLHWFHLAMGMGLLGYMFASASRQLTEQQKGYFEGSACYWHMVDLIWIFMFPIIYMVR